MDDLTFRIIESVYEATQGGGSFYVDPAVGKELEAKGYLTLLEFVDKDTGWIAAQTTTIGNDFVPTKRQELAFKAQEVAEAAESVLPETVPSAVSLPPPPPPTVEGQAVAEPVPTMAVPPVSAGAVATVESSDFEVHTGATYKSKSRKAVYPFSQLELGDFFFIPATEERPNPAQKLASTVSSASKRFSEIIGEKKVKRKGKIIDVPLYKYSRKFAITTVKKGDVHGTYTIPENGAIVIRIPVE